MGRHAQLQEERIHSQDHSFQAFYWQGLFGHFFGQVHQPAEWDKGKMRTVRGLVLCTVASSALLHYICKVGFQERGWPTEDREQHKVSSLRRYQSQTRSLPHAVVASKESTSVGCSKTAYWPAGVLRETIAPMPPQLKPSKDQEPAVFDTQGSKTIKLSSLALTLVSVQWVPWRRHRTDYKTRQLYSHKSID